MAAGCESRAALRHPGAGLRRLCPGHAFQSQWRGTGPEHGDWQKLRELFRLSSEEGGFPERSEALVDEAYRLYRKWHHSMARGLEDYPTGAAAFYHACHFKEQSDYCTWPQV